MFSGFFFTSADNDDLLGAIFQRIQDVDQLCRLCSVSKSIAAIARSDLLWSRFIEHMFGARVFSHVLKCRSGDVSDAMASQVHRILCFGSSSEVEGTDSSSGEPTIASRGWRVSQKGAFEALLRALANEFCRQPDAVCELLTRDVDDVEEAGEIMANFIGWLSPQRCGLPDVRMAAIKAGRSPSLPPLLSMPLSRAHCALACTSVPRIFVFRMVICASVLCGARRESLDKGDCGSEGGREEGRQTE
jgi:hypothetical protein